MNIHVVLYADDIGCEHCARTIETAVGGLEGVLAVHVDVATKAIELDLEGEHVLDAVRASLSEIGYPPRD